jgi:hypothetical protein
MPRSHDDDAFDERGPAGAAVTDVMNSRRLMSSFRLHSRFSICQILEVRANPQESRFR